MIATLRLFFFFGILLSPSILLAQGQLVSPKKQPDTFLDEKILEAIEARFERAGGDTARYFILDEVRNKCGNDYACLQHTYGVVLRKLEGSFQHSAGLLVAKEMVELAEQNEDIDAQTSAIGRLAGIYGFMGNQKMRTFQQEKLWSLYEQTGDIEKALRTKFSILESRVWYLGEAADVLPEMEEILEQAIERGYTATANRFRIRIKYVCEEHGFDELFAKQVEALEKIPLSTPIHPSESHAAFHAASGRADLLLKEKKYDQAKNHYLKALSIFQSDNNSHHDTWLQVYALYRIAKLEWERRDADAAKKYIQEAYDIADKTKMHDRAIMYLQLMTEIAETEKNFADAYRFTKEVMSRKAILDSLSEGFDTEKYYIQMQREQLETEKKRQALELELSRNRLRSTIAIVVLVILIALGLFIALNRQRQGKRQIADQYDVIQKQAAELKQLDAVKSRFFANISHELRTPLTLMLGPVRRLLNSQKLAEEQKALLQMANRGGKNLENLVNEILDLGKMDAGKMEIDLKPVKLSSFFGHYFAQFESLAEQQQVTYRYAVKAAPDLTVRLDREKCRQIMYNLLSNALKFSRPGDEIFATISEAEGQLELVVADTGPGIDPIDLPHVFDRYYQTKRPGASANGGTGIGLALCKEYMEIFGGHISAESSPDKGTTFRLTFPAERVPEGQLPETAVGREAGNGLGDISGRAEERPAASPLRLEQRNKPTVLIVEDNLELQSYIRMVLQNEYNVMTAGNGQEALKFFAPANGKTNKYPQVDLVLSDLMMPIMDGYQLLEKLKSEDATRGVPFIMLTARADQDDRLKALRIGVDDYLTKPFEEEELRVRIANLLKNYTGRRTAPMTENETSTASPSMGTISQADREWLEDFESYVQKNISSDALTVSYLATRFAMSESTLLRQLKRLTGLTPLKYLQEVRLDKARQLLENGTFKSISRVASEVGYSDARTFSRRFKQRFGKPPSEV